MGSAGPVNSLRLLLKQGPLEDNSVSMTACSGEQEYPGQGTGGDGCFDSSTGRQILGSHRHNRGRFRRLGCPETAAPIWLHAGSGKLRQHQVRPLIIHSMGLCVLHAYVTCADD